MRILPEIGRFSPVVGSVTRENCQFTVPRISPPGIKRCSGTVKLAVMSFSLPPPGVARLVEVAGGC